jgi:two-component system sensor histidine kinase RegB
MPLRWTLGLGSLAFAAVTLLWTFHLPLPWKQGEIFELPPTYLAGMWTAVLCATSFAALFAARIADEANMMSAALGATELVLAREQRLSALDGLAAAAAHELGTPLATIALVAKELKRELPANSPHADDVELLISQAARCREILAQLARHEQAEDEIYSQMKISSMIEDLVAPLRGSDVDVQIDCHGSGTKSLSEEPVFLRNPAVAYGLSNILSNAIDFAESRVTVRATWTDSRVTIQIEDDGPGFDELIFDRLGDPFVTPRPGYDNQSDVSSDDDASGHEGMGLGLFIAKTLLERTGATVSLGNAPSPGQGAIVRLSWPRTTIDIALSGTKMLDQTQPPLH